MQKYLHGVVLEVKMKNIWPPFSVDGVAVVPQAIKAQDLHMVGLVSMQIGQPDDRDLLLIFVGAQ